MSGDPDPTRPQDDEPGPEALTASERAARRRRRAKVFGEVLPESTSDDRAEGWGDPEPSSDEWLRRQVPPHHG